MGFFDKVKQQQKEAEQRREKAKQGFMKFSSSVDYVIFGKDYLVKLIEQWKPSRCHSEADYQKSLLNHLQTKLMQKSKKEVKIQRSRGDIVIGDVAIELKNKVDNPRVIDGVVAQCKRYERDFKGGVILVICSPMKEMDFKELEKGLGMFSKVKVVRK